MASEVVQLLRSAVRMVPEANWALWAETVSPRCMHEHHKCVLSSRKNWSAMRAGRPGRGSWPVEAWKCQTCLRFRVPQPVDPEVGEWIHGWQFHASVARVTFFAICVHLPPLSTDHQVLRVSQRGPCASRRRPHFQLRSSARSSWSVGTSPHGRTFVPGVVTTDQHVHVS